MLKTKRKEGRVKRWATIDHKVFICTTQGKGEGLFGC